MFKKTIIFIGLATLLGSSGVYAELYKKVEGNVTVYSDMPIAGGEKTEHPQVATVVSKPTPVVIAEPAAKPAVPAAPATTPAAPATTPAAPATTPVAPATTPASPAAKPAEPAAKAPAYTSFKITPDPGNPNSIIANGARASFSAELEPAFHEGDTIQLLHDGKVLAEGNGLGAAKINISALGLPAKPPPMDPNITFTVVPSKTGSTINVGVSGLNKVNFSYGEHKFQLAIARDGTVVIITPVVTAHAVYAELHHAPTLNIGPAFNIVRAIVTVVHNTLSTG